MLYSDIDTLCSIRGKATTDKTLHNMAATRLHRFDDEAIGVYYHDTEILTFRPDNTVTVRTGGWFTQTTKRRLEDFLNSQDNPINVQFTGNAWRIVTREKNPAYTGWDSPEPYWRVLCDVPYTECATINLLTGHVADGAMLEYIIPNRAMDKAIKEYVKGITPETFADGWTVKMLMGGTLQEAVTQYIYSAQIFREMCKARFDNPDVIMNLYFWPLVQNRHGQWNSAESKAAYLRREMIGWLRAMLLIGPVSIRKNYGQPRRIA